MPSDLKSTDNISTTSSSSMVDPLVTETINSALNQLHLDDSEDSAPPSPSSKENSINSKKNFNEKSKREFVKQEQLARSNGQEDPNVNITPMFPPPPHHFYPQMPGMGFMPYSQMIHMPPSPGPFFPTGELNDSSMNIINKVSGNDKKVGPIMFGEVDGINKPNVQQLGPSLWPPAMGSISEDNINPTDVTAMITNNDERVIPQSKAPGANTNSFRRQTFHTLPSAELLAISQNAEQRGSIQNSTGIAAANARTQSISFDKTDSSFLFGNQTTDNPVITSSSTTSLSKAADLQANAPAENNKNQGKTANYPAAYPYAGPIAHPNPVLPNPGSQNHGFGINSQYSGNYGFNAPFPTFSPVMGGPHPPIHGPTQMTLAGHPQIPNGPLMSDGNDTTCSNKVPFVDTDGKISPSSLPMHHMLHQTAASPPPWMYGNPAFGNHVNHPPGHPMMAPQPTHPLDRNGQHPNDKYNPMNQHIGKNDKYSYTNNKGSRYNKNGFNNFHHNRKAEDTSFYADAQLVQFVGNIYSICTDQFGCRFLQKQLDLLGKEAADIIFKETKDHTVELMTNSFGNYLIQKLLEIVTVEQRIVITKIAAPHFVEIALNPHGTRALQKLVECTETDEGAEIIVEYLSPSIIMLSKDLNGNHVVQKCLQKLKPKHFQFIFDAVCNEFTEIATHRHGCCVLQRCLDHGIPEQRQTLCNKLLEYIDMLPMDPFGNYVVQYVITKETEEDNYDYTHKIVHLLKPKVTILSLHKFGSNVVEKLLRTPVVSETVILELLNSEGEQEIQTLLNDSYGNYVLQTALDISLDKNPYLHKRLCEIVSPLLVGPIRNTPHGRRILSKLQSA